MADNASSNQPAAPFAVLVDVNPSPSAMAGNPKRPPSFPVVVVEMACVWALTNAFVSAGFSILNIILNRTPCTELMLFFRCVALTHAAAAEAGALVHGQLWCSVPQAVAAALALVLLVRGKKGKRCSRSRWALAAVAVAATAGNHYIELRGVPLIHHQLPVGEGRVVVVPAAAAVGGSRRAMASWAALATAAATHCMYARLHLLFVTADPGDTLYRIVGDAGVLGYAACDLLAFLALLLGRGV